jgi:hypothetical protein
LPKGVSILQAGDVLSLRHGVYVELVVIADEHGTAGQPNVIRSYPGEHAVIDGSMTEFRTLNNKDWKRASDAGALPDEYVSVKEFASSVWDAFLDHNPYARLIKYSKLEDFLTANEIFTIMESGDPHPGLEVMDCDAESTCVGAGYWYPWVYMGADIWIDPSASLTNPQRVHIRLAQTHNYVPGLGTTSKRSTRARSGSPSLPSRW